MRSGVIAAISTYTFWGLSPIFWKALQTVPALEILAHRTVWSFAFVAVLLLWRIRRRPLGGPRRRRARLIISFGTACLLGANWLTYIWAVNAGYIVDSSLGYFISPLVSVLLGVLFLGERLRRWQWIAVGIAASGVSYLTLSYGAFPWIALTLALTFGFYGLLRKTAPLAALEGLSRETVILMLPGVAYLSYLGWMGKASFGGVGTTTSALLVSTGVVTALPLLGFVYAAKRVTLATLGVLQYIAPSLQLLLGVLVYEEPFTDARLIGFSLIWLALAAYSLEGFLFRQKSRASEVSEAPIRASGD